MSLPKTTCYIAVTSCHNGDSVAEFRLHVVFFALGSSSVAEHKLLLLVMFLLRVSVGTEAAETCTLCVYPQLGVCKYKHMHVFDRP